MQRPNAQSSSQQALAQARQHHQAGRLQQAEAGYRQVLAQNPNQPEALYLLGLLAYQCGQHAAAGDLLARSIRIAPNALSSHNYLGEVLRAMGQLDAAIASYQNALKLKRDYAPAHNNIGNIHRQRGQFDQAAACYQAAIRSQADYMPAQLNLASLWGEMGKTQQALEACRKVVAMQPGSPEAHNNLAVAYRATGQFPQAIEHARRALELKSDFAEACNTLGACLQATGQLEEAQAAYARCVQLQPSNPEAHNNMGLACLERGLLDQAVAACVTAIELKRDCLPAYLILGTALKEQGNHAQAIEWLNKALAIDPAAAKIHNGLGEVRRALGQFDQAIACYRRALASDPKHTESLNNLACVLGGEGDVAGAVACFRKVLEIKPADPEAQSNLLFALNYDAQLSARAIYEQHVQWAKQYATANPAAPHANIRVADRPLRIGYVSPDLRRHSVAYFIEPILRHHDRHGFVTYCYADVAQADDVTRRLQELASEWRSITGLSHERAAQIVREDQIDILIDLAGHTARNRLGMFALKPAPVQVTYLGYPNTTGLTAMDYRLTDSSADPEVPPVPSPAEGGPGAEDSASEGVGGTLRADPQAWHTERLVRLPGCFLCYQPPDDCPDVAQPPATGEGRITFASFNNFTKVTPQLMGLWARVLSAVPGSRLLIKGHSMADQATRDRVRDRLVSAGIDASRLELLGPESSFMRHLEMYGRVDIALDTFPYNGTTTTCEAMWMGVPVVTLAGDRHASRVGLSLLSAVGLDELAAHSEDQYIRIAAGLAADAGRLVAMRAGMRERLRRSPLLDAAGFTANLETAYRQMWHAWCAAGA